MTIVELALVRASRAIAPNGPARGRTQRDAVIVAARSDGGATGLGEAAPLAGMSRETLDDAEAALRTLATPIAIETPHAALAIAAAIRSPAARFALESALLVAFAQRARTSVARLLGASESRALRCAIVLDAPRACDAEHVKVKVGASFDEDVARVAAIARSAPRARIRLDANRAWPRGEVHARMRAISAAIDGSPNAASRIEFVEEPCLAAADLLDEALPLPIALDESLGELDPRELARALKSPRLAALVLKPTLLGGFATCLALARAARDHGIPAIVSHALEGPIGMAACRELALAVGGEGAHGVAPWELELR